MTSNDVIYPIFTEQVSNKSHETHPYLARKSEHTTGHRIIF
jgi:hypothetical protein